MKAILFGVVAVLAATVPAAAQVVGYPPTTSPYNDLTFSQEFTPEFGYMKARTDPAGVAPKSAPMVGLRYEITLVGPLALSSEVTRSFSTRNVVNPALPASTRNLGTESAPVYSADLALAMNLTGHKSWHSIVPQLRAGIGLVHSSAADATPGGFTYGTPFAFTFGGGVKFVPLGHFQVRADVTDRVFKLTYPASYYVPAIDNTAVLPLTTATSFYTHNLGLTLGVSYLFGK